MLRATTTGLSLVHHAGTRLAFRAASWRLKRQRPAPRQIAAAQQRFLASQAFSRRQVQWARASLESPQQGHAAPQANEQACKKRKGSIPETGWFLDMHLAARMQVDMACDFEDNAPLAKICASDYPQRKLKMATAKKVSPKAAPIPKKIAAPAKVVKPAAKVAAKKPPVSKTAKAVEKINAGIAKLTERKNKINAEIQALRDQRTALKVAPAAAPAPAKAKPAPKVAVKAAAPAKKSKPAAKK
ncbi:MAG: hypothetical protein Q7U13_05580 [Rhodoferax sp.]|nr:hypothetical protein [Rhodoferax sp.]